MFWFGLFFLNGLYANLNEETQRRKDKWGRTRRKTAGDKRVKGKEKKKNRSERKDLRFRNGTRENGSRGRRSP